MDYHKTIFAKKEIAGALMKALGYRQVSRKFRTVARVDITTGEMKQLR